VIPPKSLGIDDPITVELDELCLALPSAAFDLGYARVIEQREHPDHLV